jgi:phosphoserine phosphatase
MSTPTKTLLLTFTGRDRPGVTSATLATLALAGVDVVDLEQIVLRGRLVLGLLVTTPPDPAALEVALAETAKALGMTLDIEEGTGDTPARPRQRTRVTVLGTPLKASALGAVTRRIAAGGGNIDRIIRLARYPVTAFDLQVSGADPLGLRASLAAEAAAQGIDIAVQPANLARRGMRLIVMDVDSTLIQGEVIEMLARHAGVEDQVAAVTGQAMRGEIDFAQSLRDRVALLAGLDAGAIDQVYDDLQLAPGARTTVRVLKRLGYRFAIVSGGFSQLTERLAADLDLDFHRANELEIVDGRLTGRVVGDVVDRSGKAAALRDFAAECGLPLSATIAIGDGANDLDMLNAAGLGIAFNAKAVVKEAVSTAVNVPYMDAVLYLLGISREEVVAADAEEGITTPAPPV